MLCIKLTKSAEQDLRAIAVYTVENFGRLQAEKYYSGISASIDTLAEFPDFGTSQDEIKQGLRRFIYQSDSIYFTVHEADLVIFRVLYQKQDPLRNINS